MPRCRTLLLFFCSLLLVHVLMDIVSFPYASSFGPFYVAQHHARGARSGDPALPLADAARDAYRRMLAITLFVAIPAGFALGAVFTRRRPSQHEPEGEPTCRKP